MNIIIPPTDEIKATCSLINKAIEVFLLRRAKISVGRYEFENTSLINISHGIRLIEGVIELAEQDLVLVQGALVMSRSIFEIMLKTTWILNSSDKFVSEARFVAYLKTERAFYEKWSKEVDGISQIADNKKKDVSDSLLEFENGLTILLEAKGYKVPHFPNVRDMLKSLNEERKYLLYILLSQYTHFSHYASRIYQKNLGVSKEINESPNLDLWKLAFSCVWPIFELSTSLFATSMNAEDELYSNELKYSIRDAINSID